MKTRTMKQTLAIGLSAMALGVCLTAHSAPVPWGGGGSFGIHCSLSRNGALTCTNLWPGTQAAVEWAPSVNGPWTNNWAGLDAVTVDSNGMIQVSVPMFYRVRGTGAPPGMVLIPAGAFTMGDTLGDHFPPFSTSEVPAHSVNVSAFFMDKYEVTKTLWDEVKQWAITNGYGFSVGSPGSGKAANHPVHTITWYDMVKWCNARSAKEGLELCYYTDPVQGTVYQTGQLDLTNACVKWSANGYRLPTEAEWEKAARGGASGHRFPWSDVDTISHSQANYEANTNVYAYDISPTQGNHPTYKTGGNPYTSPVGSFPPNGYGLYDMAGNVMERCWDVFQGGWYGQAGATQDDTRGPDGYPGLSFSRVWRGGDWNRDAYHNRCAYREDGNALPGVVGNFIGFRCVRGL